MPKASYVSNSWKCNYYASEGSCIMLTLCSIRDLTFDPRANLCTVEPPITDPPTSGQPLYNRHWLWNQLKLLQN